MFRIQYLRRLIACGQRLRLGKLDMCRFLWSYYGSRIPGALGRRESTQEIIVKNQARDLRLAIRTNARDVEILEEIFAREAYRFDNPEVNTILDLGGNIGLATVYFQAAFPAAQLACVEPVGENLRVLKRNFELNGVTARVFEAAAGPEDGTTQFRNRPSDPTFGSAEFSGAVPSSNDEIITVPMISVQSILDALGWDRIDLLKIDIEGGERELLKGEPAWLKKVGAVIGEGHTGWGEPYTIGSLEEQLRPFGFRVELLADHGGAFVFFADSSTGAAAGRSVLRSQPVD